MKKFLLAVAAAATMFIATQSSQAGYLDNHHNGVVVYRGHHGYHHGHHGQYRYWHHRHHAQWRHHGYRHHHYHHYR